MAAERGVVMAVTVFKRSDAAKIEPIKCPLCGKFLGEWMVHGLAVFVKKCPRCGKMVRIQNKCLAVMPASDMG